VKELYYYLDNTPTHSYMKFLYKYPQGPFPYEQLIQENARRNRQEAEFELLDTGIFSGNRYFDVVMEYAKVNSDDLCIRISVTNRGPESAEIWLLPTLWCRNRWAFESDFAKPRISRQPDNNGTGSVLLEHPKTGHYWLYYQSTDTALMTENETNMFRLFGIPNQSPFVKRCPFMTPSWGKIRTYWKG